MSGWPAERGEVTELFAVIAQDGGVVAVSGPNGEPLPMVTYVPSIAERFRSQLPAIASMTGVRVALIRASNAEVVEAAGE